MRKTRLNRPVIVNFKLDENSTLVELPIYTDRVDFENNEAVSKVYVDVTFRTLPSTIVKEGVFPERVLPEFKGDIVKPSGSSVINLKKRSYQEGVYSEYKVDTTGLISSAGTLDFKNLNFIKWDNVTLNRPTTLSGYGITNALSATEPVFKTQVNVDFPILEDDNIVNKEYVDRQLEVRGTVGDIEYKLVPNTPYGFLPCDGRVLKKADYPELYSVIGDSFLDTPYPTSLPGYGVPWLQQYNFNKQKNTIYPWTEVDGFPSNSSLVVTKNRVYALGGSQTPNSVKVGVINQDGVLGPLTDGPSLPFSIITSTNPVIIKNKLYMIGINSRNTYVANVNEDGTLGQFSRSTDLPVPLGAVNSVITKNRIYVISGTNTYVAPLNPEGVIGTWATHSTLPSTMNYSGFFVNDKKVYLISGSENYETPQTNVYTADIEVDGTLGKWTSAPSTPFGLLRCFSFYSSSEFFMVGSKITNPTTGANKLSMLKAKINSDLSLDGWVEVDQLPTVGSTLVTGFITSSKLYLIASGKCYMSNFSGGLNDYSEYYGYKKVVKPTSVEFRIPFVESTLKDAYVYIRYS